MPRVANSHSVSSTHHELSAVLLDTKAPRPGPLIPHACNGAALGIAGFGNLVLLLKSIIGCMDGPDFWIWLACECFSACLITSLALQAVLDMRQFREQFFSSDIIAMAPGFMAAAVLLTQVTPAAGRTYLHLAGFWILLVYSTFALCAFILIVWKHKLPAEPSWFPSTVGIGIIANVGVICSPSISSSVVFALLGWSAAITVILSCPVVFNVFKPGLPKVADNPTVAILVAPWSLTLLVAFCLRARGFSLPEVIIDVFFVASSVFMCATIVALVCRRDKTLQNFTPQHSALTFPLVATAINAIHYWQRASELSWHQDLQIGLQVWAILLSGLAFLVIPTYAVWLVSHVVRKLRQRAGSKGTPLAFGTDLLLP